MHLCVVSECEFSAGSGCESVEGSGKAFERVGTSGGVGALIRYARVCARMCMMRVKVAMLLALG